MVDDDLVRRLELAEAGVVRDLYQAAAEAGVRRLRLATFDVGGGVAVRLLPLDFALFDRVVGLGVAGPVTDDDLDAIVRFYDEAGVSESMVQLAPVPGAGQIEAGLTTRGYTRARVWHRRWRPLDGEPPDDPRTDEAAGPGHPIEIVDPTTTADYGAICEVAFETSPLTSPLATVIVGRPGWQHYLGRDAEGRPVAVGAMRLAGEVAWLGYGATLPAARGQGWQRAMLQRRLADARAAGCRMATTETADDASDVSIRNMARAGFTVAYPRQDWVRRVRH